TLLGAALSPSKGGSDVSAGRSSAPAKMSNGSSSPCGSEAAAVSGRAKAARGGVGAGLVGGGCGGEAGGRGGFGPRARGGGRGGDGVVCQRGQVGIHLRRVPEPLVDLFEPADGGDVLGRGPEHRLELLARGVVVAGLDEAAAERDARREVGRVPLKAGAAR